MGSKQGRVSDFPSRFAASQPIDKELWYKAPITSKDNLHGDLRGIMDHLDHIQKLGIDVMYLTPILNRIPAINMIPLIIIRLILPSEQQRILRNWCKSACVWNENCDGCGIQPYRKKFLHLRIL